MKLHYIYLGTIIITISFVVDAVEVYEQDGKEGVPEFSDTASPDAKKIKVNPNVIEVEPIKPADLPPPPDVSKATKVPDNNLLEVPGRRTVVDYGEENYKELKRDQRQRRDARGEMDGRGETIWHQQHKAGAVHRRAHRQ